MNAEATDVHQILEYRTDKWIMTWVPIALLLCLMGLIMLVYSNRGSVSDAVAGWILLAAGAGGTGFALFRRYNPGKPALVLSPEGLLLRIGSVKEILIPWREVHGVDTSDLKVWNWLRPIPPRVKLRDCTLVSVSRAFYDQHIHVDSAFMRGPGWDSLFIPNGASVQIALHHEQFSVRPDEVREPIEARWRAFRDRSRPPASPAREDDAIVRSRDRSGAISGTRPPLGMGTGPIVSSPWEMVKVAVPLIGIAVVLANYLGVWETSGQETARLEREERAEEERQEKEVRKKEQEERKKHKEEWDEHWRDFHRRSL